MKGLLEVFGLEVLEDGFPVDCNEYREEFRFWGKTKFWGKPAFPKNQPILGFDEELSFGVKGAGE